MNLATITKNSTIREALKSLNASALGVLLVINEQGKLLGTLTDGDIRRAILSGKSLTDSIEDIYNSKPSVLYEDTFNEQDAKNLFLMKRFSLIPILRRDGTIARYITWSDFFSKAEPFRKIREKIEIPVVIMAGGKGTRMKPFTSVLPKPLIPIGEKTIVEHIIDEFCQNGIKKYYFTLNYRGEMIRAYFDGLEHDYDVEYIWEKEFLGTAGSLRLFTEKAPQRFFVSNCDIIVKTDFSNVLEFHDANHSWLTIISAVQHNIVPYGVVHFTNGGKVEKIQEKPEYSFIINTGIYILDKRCLEYIPSNCVFDMTDLIQKLLDDKKPVFTYPVNEGEYIDIGQWEEYKNALDRLNIENHYEKENE